MALIFYNYGEIDKKTERNVKKVIDEEYLDSRDILF